MPKKKVTAKKAGPKERTDKAWMLTRGVNLGFKGEQDIASVTSYADLQLQEVVIGRVEALELAQWIKELFE